MIRHAKQLLHAIRSIQAEIRDTVVAACERTALEHLAAAVAEEGGDTIFAIDRVSEAVLLERFGLLAEQWPMVLIAEGLGSSGWVTLPHGLAAEAAEIRVIVDPIDGTRGLMYQKRPAWVLTGVAPNRGETTSLADIELAVMTEIPLVKQHLSDVLWAQRGQGAHAERFNRIDRSTLPFVPQPTRSTTIQQGFGAISRFFPGGRDILAAVDDALVEELLGPPTTGRVLAFEDQYISTGGQLYELIVGHDRWVADLRPHLEIALARRGRSLAICCHPYDLCTELVAREVGVIVSDAYGQPLNAPLDVETGVAWVAYANQALCDSIAPALQRAMRAYGMLE
jgi:fructose-1,6-bisphosphatase/inositol monophosphatase family enzyme